MISTKLLRLPTRGALGNGLRVVAGAVLASDGSLIVTTRNRRIKLRPERDGSTTVISAKPVKFPNGTRIEINFRSRNSRRPQRTHWARYAIMMARTGKDLHGQVLAVVVRRPAISRTAFRFRQHAGARTDCQSRRLHRRQGGRDRCRRRACPHALRRRQSSAGREAAGGRAGERTTVNPKRLGMVGPDAFPDTAYAVAYGTTEFGCRAVGGRNSLRRRGVGH